MANNKFRSDRVLSYFQAEWKVLLAVTVSGLIYNLGLLAGPWFEGKMAACLINILNGKKFFSDMLTLVLAYVFAIGVVQSSRYIKRFYVRRFANNVNRRMKHTLYGSLVQKSRRTLSEEGAGTMMTKAILDVDDCAEGMRKFTTELFDTGVALLAYAGMLLFYDWRLALISMIFPPVSYVIAEKMKVIVQRTGAAYKEQSGGFKRRHSRSRCQRRHLPGLRLRAGTCGRLRGKSFRLRALRRPGQYLERLPAAYLPDYLHGSIGLHPVFRRAQCAGPGLDGLGYRGLHYLYLLLYQACGEILQRGQAFQRGP